MQSRLVSEAKSWQQWGKQGIEIKDEYKKQVLEREVLWKKWEAQKGIQASYSYYHLGLLTKKIFPSLQYSFLIIMVRQCKEEGRGECGWVCRLLPLLKQVCLAFHFSAWCQIFTCSLLEKYFRNFLLSVLMGRARSSRYQQKEGLPCPCSQ